MQQRIQQSVSYHAGFSLKATAGLSIVEYLVAISISLICFHLILQIFLTLQNNSRYIQSFYLAIHQATTLINAINNEVKAGNRLGCEKLSSNDWYFDGSARRFKQHIPIRFTQDSLQFFHSEPAYSLLRDDAVYNRILIGNDFLIQDKDLLVISDCIHTEIVRVANHHTKGKLQSIYLDYPLHYSFAKNTMVAKIIKVEFVLKEKAIHLIVNGFKSKLANNIENFSFKKTKNALQYQFVIKINQLKFPWFSYAYSR